MEEIRGYVRGIWKRWQYGPPIGVGLPVGHESQRVFAGVDCGRLLLLRLVVVGAKESAVVTAAMHHGNEGSTRTSCVR